MLKPGNESKRNLIWSIRTSVKSDRSEVGNAFHIAAADEQV